MILNTVFNHIYVINLKKSIDRKTHIQNEFKRVGIKKYEFFEATSHDSNEVKELLEGNLVKKFPNCFRCDKKRCDCENNFLTPFQIGNWCSFINNFKDIIKNDYKFVLICEDDIVFSFQYERIINKLLSKQSFMEYNININKPLLIRLGTAYDYRNHNSKANPIFLKNYPLCNPCFAINKEMAVIYLYNLKIIDYHSDIYFHKRIPKNIPGIQFLTMYPYPVYELSFVKEKQKFDSLVRPVNAFRRIEYKEFLFLSSNLFLNTFLKNIVKDMMLDIRLDQIGYNGNINYFMLLNEKDKGRYYFEYKILLVDDYYDDIKIIYNSIKSNDKNIIQIYELYRIYINKVYNLNITFDDRNLLESIKLFYRYLLEFLDLENIIKININNNKDIEKLHKIIKIDLINEHINYYKKYKTILLNNINQINIL